MLVKGCGGIKMYVSACVVEFELKLFVVEGRRLVVRSVECRASRRMISCQLEAGLLWRVLALFLRRDMIRASARRGRKPEASQPSSSKGPAGGTCSLEIVQLNDNNPRSFIQPTWLVAAVRLGQARSSTSLLRAY